MAIQVGDVVQIKANQIYRGENVLNIFYYEVTAVTNEVGVSNVCQEFDEVVCNNWDNIVNDSWSLPILTGAELTRGIDIGFFASERVGQLTPPDGDKLPGFVCFQVKFPRSVGNIRSGFARFSGISHDDLDNNLLTNAFKLSAQPFVSSLTFSLTAESSVGQATLVPITLGRVKVSDKYVFDFTRKDRRESATLMDQVTHQVSRKSTQN